MWYSLDTCPREESLSSLLGDIKPLLDLLPHEQRQGFTRLFRKYCEKKPEITDWSLVQPPSPKMVTPLADIEPCPKDSNLQHELFNILAIVKLNGGLGTTMGCKGPKAGIEVRKDVSFLDATVKQVEYLNTCYGVDVPLILMNSFHTHDETVKIVHKYRRHNLTIHTFNQNCYPRFDAESMRPVPTKPFGQAVGEHESWYPPGHGDVYSALFNSGLLETLIEQGKEYIFISNVDNLGATVDLSILYHLVNIDAEFTMEVTEKTRSDTGGTLAEYDGKLQLLELHDPQIPSEYLRDFRSAKRYRYFNTNNLWVNLRAIQRLVAQDKLQMEVRVKQTDHTSSNASTTGGEWGGQKGQTEVVQLETAVGSAMHHFARPACLHVPRGRFIPVKSISDLFIVQSDLFTMKHGVLVMHPDRLLDDAPTPTINFGSDFNTLEEYWQRFGGGGNSASQNHHGGMSQLPSIAGLESLTVTGNVCFGSDVTLKGAVTVVADEGGRIDIPDGSVLEDQVVTGSFRVFDT